MKQTNTLITGADKGIGFETAKELGQRGQHILLGARNAQRGQAAIEKLRAAGVAADLILLDVTDQTTIDQAAQTIQDRWGYLTVLINNAGVALDHHEAPEKMPMAVIRADFDVNFFGAVAVAQAMIPLLRQGQPAKIINVSSNMGSLGLASDPKSRFYQANSLGYQSSKAALNMATISLSKALAPEITVNAVNPGYTATEFGGSWAGEQTVAEGAAKIVDLARNEAPRVTGQFVETAGRLPW